MKFVAWLFSASIVALAIALAPNAFADNPLGKGQSGSTEEKSTGKPDNPRGFGSVTSQRALNDHDIGTHVSSQSTPHLGLGNVSRNDQAVFDAAGTTNTGTRPGDHAGAIGPLVSYDPKTRPGTHEEDPTPLTPASLAPISSPSEPAAVDPSDPPAADPSQPAAAEFSEPAAVDPSEPAAADPGFSLGPLGTVSFSNSFTSLTDYSYHFGLSGGPTEFSVASAGTSDGVTGESSFSAGGFSTTTESQYGTSYDGSSCVLCQENTTGFAGFSHATEFNILADGTVELDVTNPFLDYSFP